MIHKYFIFFLFLLFTHTLRAPRVGTYCHKNVKFLYERKINLKFNVRFKFFSKTNN